MERFWTLQYLQQNAIVEVEAIIFKSFEGEPPMARADNLPLVLPVTGGGNLARGTRVLLRISGIDNISLDVHGQFIEVLQDAATLTSSFDVQTQQDDDDETPAGPVAIAVDVDEVPTAEATQP